MKKTKIMGISLSSITDAEPERLVHPDILSAHEKLKLAYNRARYAMTYRTGKPGKAMRDELEISRSNLAAFERVHGLTRK